MTKSERAVEQIRKALLLLRSVQVLEGSNKDDVERLMEAALRGLTAGKR